jgi:microcystin-dependent protein
MSQFNFGTLDPYVVDGVQLADSLNQWRDALHSMHRGAARPTYAVPGMMWVNDSAGASNWVVNIYMGATVGDKALFSYDTTTGAVTWNSGIPAGVMWDYGGLVAPPGFYLCDGSLKSRTTDALLFAAISTAYGSGDGSTTFALPDCRGRVTAMLDGGQGRLTTIANAMGATGGVDKYALATGDLPAHVHAMTDHVHVPPATVSFLTTGGTTYETTVAGGNYVGYVASTGGMSAPANTGSAGGGTAHQNTQPTIITTKIIKR